MVSDMGKLDPDDSRAPYLQISGALRSDIDTGKLNPGAQLPALQALADEYGVSLGTVKSAVAVLRDNGLVVTRAGKGSFVRTHRAAGHEQISSAELGELREVVQSLAERLDAVERQLAER